VQHKSRGILPLLTILSLGINLERAPKGRLASRSKCGGTRIMILFRFIALILIVLGLMFLGADVVTMLESGKEPVLRTLENVWGLFTATGVQSFKFWFAGLVPAPVNEALAAVLSLPAFAVLGVTGVFLAVVFRERDEFA